MQTLIGLKKTPERARILVSENVVDEVIIQVAEPSADFESALPAREARGHHGRPLWAGSHHPCEQGIQNKGPRV
jgi:hypothetical protein